MNVATWVTPEVKYGRKLFYSAVEGARSGEEEFLHGKPLHLFVDESAEHALPPAALAACIGAFGGYIASRHRSASKALACAAIVGTIGFALGLAWESRRLTASVVSGAWRKVGRARDEHWLEKNPIDYA
jgi:hypothetical protein